MTLGTTLGAGLVGLMAMVSGVAFFILPAGSRVPMHMGFGRLDSWAPKPLGLSVWPVAGAAALLTELAVTHRGRAVVGIELTVVLVVVLVAQVVGIKLSLRRGPF